jgi:hypothetical protein
METQETAGNAPFESTMFLYTQPELLTPQSHGNLGLVESDHPFEFARSASAVPIAVSEISSCAKHYPVIFSNPDTPMLVAVLGIDGCNLFVGDDGRWEANRYIPAYFRCHPFALAADSEDKLAVVIDRESDCIASEPEIPFYEGASLTSTIRERVDFCVQFTSHRRQTQEFCDRLKELELLVPRQVARKKEQDEDEVVVATFAAVDADKLQALDSDLAGKLNADGMLAAAYHQLSSMENWQYLLARHDDANVGRTGGEP